MRTSSKILKTEKSTTSCDSRKKEKKGKHSIEERNKSVTSKFNPEWIFLIIILNWLSIKHLKIILLYNIFEKEKMTNINTTTYIRKLVKMVYEK